jgi:chromosome segregation ATPase
MTNIPRNFPFRKNAINPGNHLSNSQFMFTYGAGNKFKKIKQIKNSRSQKFSEEDLLDTDKKAERFLLKKIDEVNKTLEESENIFRYNQKIMKKKLEEKNNEIKKLKTELEEEKIRKKSLYENIYNESKNNFMDDIKQLQKQVEKLTNMNTELSEQNLEYEKKIENLENKNRSNISKLQEMKKKYDSLIQQKTNDLIEDEIKQYINELNSQIDSRQNELNSLNEEMNYLNEENKRLKFLTKEIIEARNETEIFFLEVLNDAKMELYKQKKEKIKRDCFFPKLKNFYEEEYGNGDIKVDIRELTPELREKILRNLFQKINAGYDEKNFKELMYIMDEDMPELRDEE